MPRFLSHMIVQPCCGTHTITPHFNSKPIVTVSMNNRPFRPAKRKFLSVILTRRKEKISECAYLCMCMLIEVIDVDYKEADGSRLFMYLLLTSTVKCVTYE